MVFFILLVGLPAFVLAQLRTERHARALRARFDRQCLAIQIASVDPRLRFDGRSATVVRNTEERGQRGQLYSIERFARNRAGEYFLILSNEPGTPFVKHVTHEMARALLQAAYVAP